MVEQSLTEGHKPNEITDKALSAAMNVVGKDFGAKKSFYHKLCYPLKQCVKPSSKSKNVFQLIA